MLRRRELEAAGTRVSESAGQVYHPATDGGQVAGTYGQCLDLASGRFAMIDDGLAFTLVSWTPSLERYLGRHVSGIARAGRIEWDFGRMRGSAI